MVTLNKIYTRTGDSGTTALGDGKRTKKFSLRVEAYGSVDELNCFVGLARHYATSILLPDLIKVQNDLFDLGADLCNPVVTQDDSPEKELRIQSNQVKRLEQQIDIMNTSLKPLKSFVLPGGSISASHLHLCRTVCRRAERCVTELDYQNPVSSIIIAYINRLSDYFFTLSRIFALDLKIEEVKWSGN